MLFYAKDGELKNIIHPEGSPYFGYSSMKLLSDGKFLISNYSNVDIIWEVTTYQLDVNTGVTEEIGTETIENDREGKGQERISELFGY